MHRPFATFITLALLGGCAASSAGSTDGSTSSSSSGSGGATAGSSSSSSGGSSGAAVVTEVEPNGGATTAEVNQGTVPGVMSGVVDPADDLDIFAVELVAGTFVQWELTGPGGVLAPHLGLSQDGNNVPTMAARAGAGASAVQQHFVLESGRYYAIVRDTRNVPASTSAHVGSPAHTWRLEVTTPTRTHRMVSLPSTQTGTLATATSVDTWQFSGTANTGFDVVLNAQRLATASDMDSRLSLFHVETADWIITNDDDVAESTVDSHVGGTLPATGTYVVVVENIAPAPARLAYELVFSLR
jgi:hypothetical protein